MLLTYAIATFVWLALPILSSLIANLSLEKRLLKREIFVFMSSTNPSLGPFKTAEVGGSAGRRTGNFTMSIDKTSSSPSKNKRTLFEASSFSASSFETFLTSIVFKTSSKRLSIVNGLPEEILLCRLPKSIIGLKIPEMKKFSSIMLLMKIKLISRPPQLISRTTTSILQFSCFLSFSTSLKTMKLV